MMKYRILAIFLAMGMPLPALSLECNEFVQKIFNDGDIEMISLLQSGGNFGGNVLDIEEAHCKRIVQEVVNQGNIRLISLLQSGGNFGINVAHMH